MNTAIRFGWVLAVGTACFGCPDEHSAAFDAGSDSGVVADSGEIPFDSGAMDTGAPDAGLAASDVEGYWSGDWGDMVMREVNGELWGAYTHDTGTIRGTVTDGKFVGWWCEVPSRMPPSDAGDVEFDFIEAEDGTLSFDGRWRYAGELPDGAWREDWDLARVEAEPPTELVARFDDASVFCSAPKK